MEDRGERAGWEAWNGWDASLGETRPRGSVSPRPRKRVEGRATLAIPTVLEPGWKIEASGRAGRPGTVGMRVSERRAHVAQSLRDRESGWKDGQSLLFRQSSNRDGRSRRTVGPGGLERSECESRRDAPTWLSLSETEKAGGRTGNPCYSDSPRTGMEDRGERWDREAWNGRNASLGETRPRGRIYRSRRNASAQAT